MTSRNSSQNHGTNGRGIDRSIQAEIQDQRGKLRDSVMDQTFVTESEGNPLVMLQLMKEIPIFSGLPTEDFRDWFRRACVVANAAGIPTEKLVNLLPTRFAGRAEECFHSLKKKDAENKTIRRTLEELAAEMRQALKLTRSTASSYAECQNRRKQNHESIREYATEIRKLTRGAYEDLPKKHLDMITPRGNQFQQRKVRFQFPRRRQQGFKPKKEWREEDNGEEMDEGETRRRQKEFKPKKQWKEEGIEEETEDDETRYEDNKRNSTRRAPFNMYRQALNLMMIMSLFITMSMLPITGAYQICKANAIPTYLQIPKPMSCELAKREATHDVKITLFIPKATPVVVNATRCRKVIRETCARRVFFIRTSGIFTTTRYEALSKHECLVASENAKENPYKVETPEDPGGFFGTMCNTSEQIEVVSGTVAYNQEDQMISNLGTLRGCTPEKGICKSENRTIIWSTIEGREHCWVEEKGTFKAIWSQPKSLDPEDVIMVIPKLTAAFQLSPEPLEQSEVACVGIDAMKLNHGAYAIFQEGNRPEIQVSHKKLRLRRRIKEDGEQVQEKTIPELSHTANTSIAEREGEGDKKIRGAKEPTTEFTFEEIEEVRKELEVIKNSTKREGNRHQEHHMRKFGPGRDNQSKKRKTHTDRPTVDITIETDYDESERTRHTDEWHEPEKETESVSTQETNVRIQFLERNIQRIIDNTFDDFFIKSCRIENEIRQTAIEMAQLKPTWAARTLLAKTNIAAVFAGHDILAVTQCTEVTPEKIFHGKKVDDICYLQTPVKVDGELWFVADGTVDLSKKGRQIECNDRPQPPVYLEDGKWTDGMHDIHVFKIDTNTVHRKHGDLLLFNTPDIFEHETDVIASDLLEPLTDIEARIDKLEVVTVGSIASDIAQATRRATRDVTNLYKQAIDWTGIWNVQPFKTMAEYKYVGYIIIAMIGITSSIAMGWYIYPCLAPLIRWRRMLKRRWSRAPSQERIQTVLMKYPEREDPTEEYNRIISMYSVTQGRRRLPHVDIKIAGIQYKALVDTGATASIIRKREAIELIRRGRVKVIKNGRTEGRAVNKTKINFEGAVVAMATLGDQLRNVEITLVITEELPSPILLGIDIWRKMKASIDLENNRIITEKGVIEIHSTITSETTLPKAHLPFGVWLKPGDNFLKARARELNGQKIYMTKKAEKFNMEGVDFMETVLRGIQRNEVPIRIINRTTETIYIEPMTNLAQLEEVNPEKEERNVVQEINRITVGPTEYLSPEADVTRFLPGKKETPPTPKSYYIRKVIDWEAIQLSEPNKFRLRRIIRNYLDAFVGPEGSTGNFRGPVKHKIDLVDPTLITRQPPYKIPYNIRGELKEILGNLLESKIITPTTSPFQAPIIMVKKNNGKYRLAIDYRRLNSNIKPAASPVASIEDIINSIGNKKLFTVLDLQNAYHSIHVEKEDFDKLAFITPFGPFTYTRSPFGLSTSPAVFQQALAFALREVKACVYHYVDDIIIASNTEEQHLSDIEETLAALEKHGLKVAAEKAQFARKSVTYLGLKLEGGRVSQDPSKIKRIMEIKPPKTLKELRSLLAMFSYHRRFVKNFARTSAPLYELTKLGKSVMRDWTKKHTEILETLKKAITTAPALIIPNLEEPFTLETDGSKEGIGAALMQQRDGILHPVAYFSRKTNKFEKNYSAAELESLAVVAALQHFRHYVINNGYTTIITDSTNACSLMKRPANEGRMGRFQVALFPYKLIFKHRAGKLNTVCDHLSRYPEPGAGETISFTELRSGRKPYITLQEIKEEQTKQYPWLFDIILFNVGWPTDPKAKKELEKETQYYLIKQGIIYRSNPEEHRYDRPLMPYSLREKIIKEYHEDPLIGGHMGVAKIMDKIKERAWWPRMDGDIAEIIKACQSCQMHKTKAGDRVQAIVRPIITPSRPFERVHIDTIGPIPSTGGNRFNHILVIRDALTRFTILEPLKTVEANEITTAIEQQLISIFGVPESVVTDNHKSLTGKAFKELERAYGIKHTTTCPYNPSANGMVERSNRVIMDGIKQNADAKNWDLVYLEDTPTYLAITYGMLEEVRRSPTPMNMKEEGR
ncbi:hypothetical protein FO519_008502 [Halicephalobus sp. NKZ332]|nr:hypothetical protein FO519_008502 [Halicephalobus sp. NKZ332]